MSRMRREETALDWYRRAREEQQHRRRTQRRRQHDDGEFDHAGTSPQSARKRPRSHEWWRPAVNTQHQAAAVANPPTTTSCEDLHQAFWERGTGLSYLDAAWRVPRDDDDEYNSDDDCGYQNHELPGLRRHVPSDILLLEGPTAKTWTLRSLVARFLVHTRSTTATDSDTTATENTPQVLVLDSTLEWTRPGCPALARVVRASLVKNSSHPSEPAALQTQIEDCLDRVHIVTADTLLDWIPILQVVASTLRPSKLGATSTTPASDSTGNPTSSSNNSSSTPWLVVWDGFPGPPAYSGASGGTNTTATGGAGGTSMTMNASMVAAAAAPASMEDWWEVVRAWYRVVEAANPLTRFVLTTRHPKTFRALADLGQKRRQRQRRRQGDNRIHRLNGGAGRRLQRILLQPRATPKDCQAHVVVVDPWTKPPPFAFSLSLDGILS